MDYARMLLPAATAKKPYKRRVTYIQAVNGWQYINTGVVAKSGLETEIKAAITSTGSVDNDIIGAYDGSHRIFAPCVYNNWFRFGYNTVTGNLASYEVGTAYTIYCKLAVGDQLMSIDGVTKHTGTNTTELNLGYPLYIFVRNQQGSPRTNTPALARFFYCKIWDNGSLVRDFIPVLDWNDTPCVYDKVSKQLFYNSGTNTFIYA